MSTGQLATAHRLLAEALDAVSAVAEAWWD
jgi:hypothetical protein